MDTLSRILDALEFNGVFYYATRFSAAWSIDIPKYKHVVRFHYVTQGACWVRVENHLDPVLLLPGDLIIIPHGAKHILSDSADREPVTLDQALEDENYQGDGVFKIGEGLEENETQLVCGHFEFCEIFQHPLITNLPDFIIKKENNESSIAWTNDTLKLISDIAHSKNDGSAAVIKRLSEVIFIQVLQYWNENNPNKTGFITALNDTKLSKAIQAFHKNIAHAWTIEKLANEALMSRALFASKFKHYMGVSAMQYVTNWRMQEARKVLERSTLSLEQVAVEVGYDSAAAFSKAFKRIYNETPGSIRN